MLGIEEQFKIYKEWCKNNDVSPKDANNLIAYVKEIREAYDADRWNPELDEGKIPKAE